MNYLEAVWNFVSEHETIVSVAGTVLAMVVGFAFKKKPEWLPYASKIVDAIKLVESNIPDNTENVHLKRIDEICRVFADWFKETNLAVDENVIRSGVETIYKQYQAEKGTIVRNKEFKRN